MERVPAAFPSGPARPTRRWRASATSRISSTLRASPRQRHGTRSDVHAAHAPVGCFSANGYGLHDVIGNVSEWCEPLFGGYWMDPFATADHGALLPRAASPRRACCAAAAGTSPSALRTSERQGAESDQRRFTLGCRAARPIDE
ncbi:MAG: SUMF1/EgtB/PvdO family nonheme iron enzyme [Planctomycetota bacterium]